MSNVNVTSPVCRLVQGSLYKPSTTDQQGNLLVFKKGPNIGQPRVDYWFKVAIPKAPGQTHWAQKPATWDVDQVAMGRPGFPYWGESIWAEGNRAFPAFAQSPRFSWKIEDGDDATPNPERKGRRNCDTEGFPGNWILKLSGGFAPKVYQREGTGYVQITQEDFCKPGSYVEVTITPNSNNNDQKPGLHLNHSMVCFRAYGQEISFGPDVAAAGFGAAPLPAGASAIPLAGAAPMPAAPAAGVPPAPLVPGGFAQTPQPPAPAAPAPIPVIPNLSFVQVPTAPAAPLAPPPAPAAPAHRMTAAAGGFSYESYIDQGWTDAMLVQNGMMLA